MVEISGLGFREAVEAQETKLMGLVLRLYHTICTIRQPHNLQLKTILGLTKPSSQ